MIGFVHALFAMAFSRILGVSVLWSVIGSLLPDIDLLLPVQHRMITHSLVFVLAVYVLVRLAGRSRQGFALSFGMLTHLFLDSLTPMGIGVFYPLQNFFSLGFDASRAGYATILLSIIVIANQSRLRSFFKRFGGKKIKTGMRVSVIAWLIALIFWGGACPLVHSSIGYILSGLDGFSEKKVMTSGVVCSEIEKKFSKAGNEFQVFELCDGPDSLVVWKLASVERKDLNKGDHIIVCGLFTLKYLSSSGPEIYMVSKVT
ncbi:MAG: metal-dependent hydrolase [Nanoarchaeota archaeon]|nr:metal-dependent hydrolase [Nanoarchaeota archaeon]